MGQRCSRDDVLSLLTLPQSFHTSHKQARGGGVKRPRSAILAILPELRDEISRCLVR